MKDLASGLELIVSRKDSRNVIIFTTLLLFLLLLAIQNGDAARSALSFTVLPFFTRVALAFQAFFDIRNTFTASSLILAVLGSLVAGINISMAYTYMRLRGEVILHSGLYSGVGLFFAFLGIGCVACGTALLSVILGFFGFTTMLAVLPYQGQEIGYIGLIFLLMATYALSKKVMSPTVC